MHAPLYLQSIAAGTRVVANRVSRWLLAIVPFLVFCSSYAQDEGKGANAPVETVQMGYVILFGVIFVGSIVGFFWYLWWSGRKRKD
jgi:hypothetical protein